MARYPLNETEITTALTTLPGWQIQEGKLVKQFKFGSFAKAIGWMVTVALIAEKMNHHPEWSNVYNRVTVALVTHDLGNVISNLDVELATRMEQLAV